MMSMWKHIYRLNFFDTIFFIQQIQIPRLSCRITTDINGFFTGSANKMVFMTSSCIPALGGSVIITSGLAMFIYKILCKNILHISGIKQCITDAIQFRIYLCIFNRFRNILYSYHFRARQATKFAIVPVPYISHKQVLLR